MPYDGEPPDVTDSDPHWKPSDCERSSNPEDCVYPEGAAECPIHGVE